MKYIRNATLRQTFAYSTISNLILAAVTYTAYLCHLDLATAGFLCLIVVVLLSSFGNMVSATVYSVVAVACLDYFFAPPILSLRVSDPLNILALAAFLTTSLSITFQVTRVRRERLLSELQRKEMKRLIPPRRSSAKTGPQLIVGSFEASLGKIKRELFWIAS